MKHGTIKCALFLNYALFAILLNSVGTVILQVQMTYGVGKAEAAILEAFKDLSIAGTSFFAASLALRFGYRRSLILAVCLVSLACLAMPFVATFTMNKVMFAVIGVTFAVVKISSYSILGLITNGEKEHASLMSFIESFFMVGIFFSYFLFSWFVNDENSESTEWLRVYLALAAGGLICILAMLFARLDEPSKDDKAKQLDGSNEFAAMLLLAIKPIIIVFVISVFLYILIEQSIMTWLPTFNNEVLNMSASLSIQMASILSLSFALGRFLAGFALRKLPWFPVVSVCLVLAAALVLLALPLAKGVEGPNITTWSTAPIAAFVFPLLGVCLAPIYPAIVSVALSSLPKHQHAPMSGLIIIFGALGGTCGSIITGNLFEVLGGTSAFYLSLVPIAIMIVSLYLFNHLTTQQSVPVSVSGAR